MRSLLVGLLVCGVPGPALAGSPEISPVVQTQPEPPTGRPMFGWGVFGVTLGIVNIGYGIPLAILGFGDASAEASIPIVFGAGFVVLGSLGIHYGKRRRAAWRIWASANPQAAQHARTRRRARDRAGTGMLISGTFATLGGITTLPIAIVHPLTFGETDDRSPIPSHVGAAVSAASIVTGITLLGIGGHRRAKENRAHRSTTCQLVPTGWADAHGWSVGVAGRF
jgi:hypothetical protein